MHMKMRSENKKMNPSCLIPFVISFHSHLIATPGSVVYGQLHCCGFIGKLNKKSFEFTSTECRVVKEDYPFAQIFYSNVVMFGLYLFIFTYHICSKLG